MEKDKQLLQTITIPKYIYRVKLSNKRRKRYYSKRSKKTWSYKSLTGKYAPIKQDYNGPPFELPAPKSKLIKVYEGQYEWYNNYLRDKKTEKRIVANPQAAGTPNWEKLSGNSFASGYGSHHIRNTLVHAMKDFYRPFVQDQLNPISDDDFPLWIDWHLYTTIPDRLFDLTNFWFYYKYFEDCLFESKDPNGNQIKQIIPDDNVTYITKPGVAPILHPIQDFEHRKFVFKIYKDQRSCLQSHKLYQN